MKPVGGCGCVLALLLLLKISESQLPPKRTYHSIRDDLVHVRCETCQKGVRAAYSHVSGLREDSKNKKLSEDTALDHVEKLCDPRKEEGYWIRGLDIQEVGGQVKLVEQDGKKGSCRRECETLAQACEETISEVDTDLAESLYRGKLTLSQTLNKVCYDLTDACTRKTPFKGRQFDEVFEEASDKDLEMERLMSKMRGMPGMPGMEMYSRDDLKQMTEELGDVDESEDGDLPKETKTWYDVFWQKLHNGLSWVASLFYNPLSAKADDEL